MTTIKNVYLTDFQCRICQQPLVFDANDPGTYVSKSDSENFFSMSLTRYVVKHETPTEDHYNVIIVDADHQYRGHKDSYKTPKQVYAKTEYTLTQIQALPHSKIEFLILLNINNKKILEAVNIAHLKTLSIIERVTEFIDKNKDIYEQLPDQL